jgi:hypothetical protein
MTLRLARTEDQAELFMSSTPGAAPARPWANRSRPRPSVHGMLTGDERDYLMWIAATSQGGRIVELGCFLGCSTAALLTGLRERDSRLGQVDPQARVITYDSFVMPHGGGGRWAPGVNEGEWFGDLFEKNIAPLTADGPAARLQVHHGWLPESVPESLGASVYPEQDAIDVLFVDLAKTWGVHTTVLNVFLPLLGAGGMMVQQDFKSWLPWQYLHMWQLRDQLEPVHDVPGGSVGFIRTRAPGGAQDCWTASAFPAERFDEVWDQVEASWRGFGSGQAGLHATLARGRHAIMVGRHDHGVECFERVAATWRGVLDRPGLAPWRDAFAGIWSDALATMRRGLVKARAGTPSIDRAAAIGA